MAVKGAGRRVEVSDEDRRELERIVGAASSEKVFEKGQWVTPGLSSESGSESSRHHAYHGPFDHRD